MKRILTAIAVVGCLCISAQADNFVTVGESTDSWLGYMNVFNLPADGGAFQFGSGWGVPDLVATFDDGGNTLTLSPNTIGDPDPYWYQGGGGPGALGNKIMDANLYIENSALNDGTTLNFSGDVLSDTFTSAHSTTIFIKEYVPDFSSFTGSSVVVSGAGAFSLDYLTSGNPGNVIQYGFTTTGENVWVTDTAPFGSVVIGTIPEPATIGLVGIAGLGMFVARRRFMI